MTNLTDNVVVRFILPALPIYFMMACKEDSELLLRGIPKSDNVLQAAVSFLTDFLQALPPVP
jgi:hypothetical protein